MKQSIEVGEWYCQVSSAFYQFSHRVNRATNDCLRRWLDAKTGRREGL